MEEPSQVKVDNWGVFFLQRLKHFFNRTDYCDLTLQFQDNAQLKVHRLVLNACTEYFDLLERTCEMYEDCLIMPDDLQADVVVPIVNFMYTGQLEYKHELLDKLYQTAQIMNMTVLTKLLDAQRNPQPVPIRPRTLPSSGNKQYKKVNSYGRPKPQLPSVSNVYRHPFATQKTQNVYGADSSYQMKKRPMKTILNPKPTRYELPEELDTDNLFDNSFSDITYDSKPLMVHPDRQDKDYYKYTPSSSSRFEELRNIMKRPSTSAADVEFKKIKTTHREGIFSEADEYIPDESQMEEVFSVETKQPQRGGSSQMFESVVATHPAKVTIEKSNSDINIDHAKIISEVLKKYPHLMKSNKNIKLKVVNSQNKSVGNKIAPKTINTVQPMKTKSNPNLIKVKTEQEDREYTYETDITDIKDVARLIALGLENVKGPWLCLICGTPGKALNFLSYHKFRNHLVNVHNERTPSNMCEYCGLKSGKRNHLLHHIYTKHGVPPPPSYNFPKCNQCSYVALTQAFLIKHKMTHTDNGVYNCNVCLSNFSNSKALLHHIQQSGHKISPERKANMQCIYCMKVFLRESNLYTHLKTMHKQNAKQDGIIDFSDEDPEDYEHIPRPIKFEKKEVETEEESDESEYQIQSRDGKIQIINKTPKSHASQNVQMQKILNQGFSPKPPPSQQVRKPETRRFTNLHTNKHEDEIITPQPSGQDERMVILNQAEYIQHAIDVPGSSSQDEYIISDIVDPDDQYDDQTITFNRTQSQTMLKEPITQVQEKPATLIKKTGCANQSIQIVVSNEQEYKALMASNPSILFEDGSQKSLSVLAHGSNVDPQNMAIDNPQDNMMIIQDNYPMVSQAISSDNSNIVVVYSHPIDTQGKQYVMNTQYADPQIITTQGVPEQLIQSSQVITQNYETITTAEGEHVLLQGPIGPWQQQNMQPLESSIIQMSTMQPREEIVQPQILQGNEQVSTIVDGKLSDLTTIQIMKQAVPEIHSNTIDESMEDEQDNQAENRRTCYENADASSEEITQPETEEVPGEYIECEEQAHVIESGFSNNGTLQEAEIVQNETQESASSVEDQSIIVQAEEDIETSVESTAQNPADSESVHQTSAPVVAGPINKQIQTLASEWSDEESTQKSADDSVSQENPENETTESQQVKASQEQITKTTNEIEESIENIQHEVNQISYIPPSKRVIITNDIILPRRSSSAEVISNMTKVPVIQETPVEPRRVEENVPGVPKANEKISSLLNDWDDNDSQNESNVGKSPEPEATAEKMSMEIEKNVPIDENNESVEENNDLVEENNESIEENNESVEDNNESVEENNESVEDTLNEEMEKDVVQGSNGNGNFDMTESDKEKPEDKIKSLVSDWDEEEEEAKEA